MENTYTSDSAGNNQITSDVGIGLPVCECGRCTEALFGDSDEVVITAEALKDWLQGVCPGKKVA